jgi:NADH:ubiquinone oxidoreductase subunit 5 (subunit L)/multisubunit Na+/H+ antiporter MnhA subunit
MAQILQLFIWIPLIGFTISLLLPRKKESILSAMAISTTALQLTAIVGFLIYWMRAGGQVVNVKHLVLYSSGDIEIFINFYFDKVTAVFCLVGSIIAFLVSIFSKYYMHREEGFKRYFCAILFFFFGYNLVIFSGNFETLFVGWEILGICSFLLIAFYRDRYLPVKNGLKVLSFFRFGDVCILLAMWMSHHLWHRNITFFELTNPTLVLNQLQEHYPQVVFVCVTIFLAAVIKSAQFPFTSWLPRAMEGPTTSSAIFYGSLSVHLGVFLLLRTHPLWQHAPIAVMLVIITGLTTAIVATLIARVQSTVKTQIAYSSAAQIGLIFIEVALGFHLLALVHFAGNAFLRTYQLLVSPSVMSYLTHNQFYNFAPGKKAEEGSSFLNKIKNTVYILSIKEWNMDVFLNHILWKPFKAIGSKFNFLQSTIALIILAMLFAGGLYVFIAIEKFSFAPWLPYLFASIAVMLILNAFADRGDPRATWILVFGSQFFIALAIALNNQFELHQVVIYLSGGLASAIVGYICLSKIRTVDSDVSLDKFHGYAYEKPQLGLVFLLACLGLVAFPITPAFLGFDILLTHIRQDQYILILLASICFVFIELSVLRIYARLFMGQHKKPNHAIAYRSS